MREVEPLSAERRPPPHARAAPPLAWALAMAVLLAAVPALVHGLRGQAADAAAQDQPLATLEDPAALPPPAWPEISWRSSRAAGLPHAGRLVRGVRLPAEGEHFFGWDPIRERSPNRGWRRYGTDRLVRTVLRVLARFRAAHPDAPRVGIGDLSRPRGGDFGPRFGGLGHASHQNGLDVDVYYPRLDRLEREPGTVAQIDRRLAQDLVDRFVDAGARYVFVGPRTRLEGPRRIVQVLVHHDDHLHVRIPAR